jgi:hypothetical protein
VLPPHLAIRPRKQANNPGRPFISLANHLGVPSPAERDAPARVLALQVSGSGGLDWSPHRGYLPASGDRLIVLATRQGLSPFLSVH